MVYFLLWFLFVNTYFLMSGCHAEGLQNDGTTNDILLCKILMN